MDVFTTLLDHITKAKAVFDNTDNSVRYESLYPIFLDIDKCMGYIRNNEDYTKYTIFLETLDAVYNGNNY